MRRNPKGTKTTGLQRAKFGLPAIDDLVTPEPAPQKLVNDKVPSSFVTRVTPHLSEGDVHSIFLNNSSTLPFAVLHYLRIWETLDRRCVAWPIPDSKQPRLRSNHVMIIAICIAIHGPR